MHAYIVIGALAVLAISARIYTANTQDRISAGLNCTVDCSGYDAGHKWVEEAPAVALKLNGTVTSQIVGDAMQQSTGDGRFCRDSRFEVS